MCRCVVIGCSVMVEKNVGCFCSYVARRVVADLDAACLGLTGRV